MLLLDLICGRKVNTSLHLTIVFINASHDDSFCLSLASRCQRGERRYIKLSNKHQATTRRLRELEKFHQKYSVLVNSDKTSTVSCWCVCVLCTGRITGMKCLLWFAELMTLFCFSYCPRRAWAATGIVVCQFVCLFVLFSICSPGTWLATRGLYSTFIRGVIYS